MCMNPPNEEIKVKKKSNLVNHLQTLNRAEWVQNWPVWKTTFDLPSSCGHDWELMLGLERGHPKVSKSVKIQDLSKNSGLHQLA